jgi:hypothetical protein
MICLSRETCWFVIASLKCLLLMFCLPVFSGDTTPSNTKMTVYMWSTCTYKNWIIFWICEYNWKVFSISLAENKYKQKGNRDLSSCKSVLQTTKAHIMYVMADRPTNIDVRFPFILRLAKQQATSPWYTGSNDKWINVTTENYALASIMPQIFYIPTKYRSRLRPQLLTESNNMP